MKIKIIDLLNKIANGEELPKKIKLLCDDEIFIYEKEKDDYIGENGDGLFNECILDTISLEIYLNDEVEIIEEPKKIEKITVREKTLGFPNGEWTARNTDKAFAIKINELIDEIKNLKEKKEEQED